MRPKSDPRGTNIEDKNEDEIKIVRRSSWTDLGPILGLFRSRLGGVEWGFAGAKLHFVKRHVFEKNKVSRGDLVPIFGQFEHPRGSKMEAVEGQKVS